MSSKPTVILYHASCPDGFGAAYAAWKKFGDAASYIPVFHDEPVPVGLEGKIVYMVDFSYPKELLLGLEKSTERLVVLDHHIGAKADVEAVREHIFDNNHSGTGIAWNYFHPDVPLPRLLAYIQDADLWKHALPNNKEIGAFLSIMPLHGFETFESLVERMEDDAEFEKMREKGAAYAEYLEYLYRAFVAQAQEIQFGEYRILAVNAPRLLRSELGHRLAEKQGPFAIVFYFVHGEWHLSMRGNGTIDLATLAQTYGGNGHKNAASITVHEGEPFPFTFVK